MTAPNGTRKLQIKRRRAKSRRYAAQADEPQGLLKTALRNRKRCV